MLLFKPPFDLINANTFLHYNVCITSQDTRCLSPSPSQVHLSLWCYQVSSIPGSLSALYKVLSPALRFIWMVHHNTFNVNTFICIFVYLRILLNIFVHIINILFKWTGYLYFLFYRILFTGSILLLLITFCSINKVF